MNAAAGLNHDNSDGGGSSSSAVPKQQRGWRQSTECRRHAHGARTGAVAGGNREFATSALLERRKHS